MKRKTSFIVSICILSLLIIQGESAPSNLDFLVRRNSAFAVDIYKKLSEGKGNVFLSPFSISSALAMTYAGARGQTAEEMARALHFDLPQEELHQGFSELFKRLDSSGKGYKLNIANALWGQKGYHFEPDFIGLTNKYYGGGFKEVDFAGATEQSRQTINKWVEDKTENKIKELLKQGDIKSLTRLVLTNAIYFKGNWEVQFDKKKTRISPFYISEKDKVDVPMMEQKGRFNYVEDDEVQVLELPYSGKELSMVIILPKSNIALSAVEKKLSFDKLQSWLSSLSENKVDVYMPRFKIEERYVLNEILEQLGMPSAFEPGAADFSGMTGRKNLYIGLVVHKSFVEVNEEGTEAAAATAVVMNTKALVENPVFRANRPFIFLIRDTRSGTILFIGRLVYPG